jgi:hypothetical protein
VQSLGHGLGQAVGQGLAHDGVVVVVGGLETGGQFGRADAGGDGEAAEVVDAPADRGATKSDRA